MTDRDQRAVSFGAVAGDYDRLRPSPPPAALDWLVPATSEVAVDVGAGTGLFSRALRERTADRVIAVEPDERMRRVLAGRSPGVAAVGGRAESLPLRDAVADGVFVSSAWHWMDPARTVPEFARILRDGGRFGLIWTSRDRDVDWLRDLDRLRTSFTTESDEQVAAQWRRHEVELPPDSPFTDQQTASFTFTRSMPVDDLVAWLGTYSVVITATAEERTEGLGRVRAALVERFGDGAVLDVPLRSHCWRADRLPR